MNTLDMMKEENKFLINKHYVKINAVLKDFVTEENAFAFMDREEMIVVEEFPFHR